MKQRAGNRLRRVGLAPTDTLYKIKQLAAKVLSSGKDVSVSSTEMGNAVDELNAYVRRAGDSDGGLPGLWSAVGEQNIDGLNALYALALRHSSVSLSPGVNDSLRAGYAALRSRLTGELCLISFEEENREAAARARLIVVALLRSHLLRCLGALLKDASAAIEPQLPRPSRRSVQLAKDVLAEAHEALRLLRQFLYCRLDGENDIYEQKRKLCVRFTSELAASQLLEHWSRLLLHLSACEAGVDDAARQLACMATTLSNIDQYVSIIPRVQERRHSILVDSPSLAYLLSSHVVGLCAWLDGGSTYGMPPAVDDDEDEGGAGAAAAAPAGAGGQLRHRAPLFCPRGARLRPDSSESACTTLAEWALGVWGDALRVEHLMRNVPMDAATPVRFQPLGLGVRPLARFLPLHTPAMLDVCLRLVSAVVEGRALGAPAAASVVTGAARRGVQARGQVPRLAGGPENVSSLAVRALRCGRAALGEPLMLSTSATPAAQAALRRWVSALVGFMGTAAAVMRETAPLKCPTVDTRGLKEEVFAVAGVRHVLGALPPAPHPCVAAALDAGYVAALDNLLRSAEHLSLDVRVELVGERHCFMDTPLQSGPWDQLLAFGDPHETAPLLSTLARLVRAAVDGNKMPQPFVASNALLALSGVYSVCDRALSRPFWLASMHLRNVFWPPQQSLEPVEEEEEEEEEAQALQAGRHQQAQETGQQAEEASQQVQEQVQARQLAPAPVPHDPQLVATPSASGTDGHTGVGYGASAVPVAGNAWAADSGSHRSWGSGGSGSTGRGPSRVHDDVYESVADDASGACAAAEGSSGGGAVAGGSQAADAAPGSAAAGGSEDAGQVPGGPEAGPPPDPTAPGSLRLGLLTSYMVVHLMPAAREALVRGYLPSPVFGIDCLGFHVTLLLMSCTVVAAAALPPAVKAPDHSAADSAAAQAAAPAAPSGVNCPSPSSAREEWRAVLLEDLCLAEVLGAALGLLARENASGVGAARATFEGLSLNDAVLCLMMVMMLHAPEDLQAALRSERAERVAAMAARESDGNKAAAAADTAAAGGGRMETPGSSHGGQPLQQMPATIARGLEALEACKLEYGIITGLLRTGDARTFSRLRRRNAWIIAALQKCTALLSPPSRLLELLPVDLSAAEAARPGGSRY